MASVRLTSKRLNPFFRKCGPEERHENFASGGRGPASEVGRR
jgi:hypothetical protein